MKIWGNARGVVWIENAKGAGDSRTGESMRRQGGTGGELMSE